MMARWPDEGQGKVESQKFLDKSMTLVDSKLVYSIGKGFHQHGLIELSALTLQF